MAKNYYSGAQRDLAFGAQNLLAIVTPEPATYGLGSAMIASYSALVSSYVAALALATEPATRTIVTVALKNEARRLLKTATLDIARTVTSVPTVSNAQLLALNLNPRVAPQPAQVPQDAPAVHVIAVVGRHVKLRIYEKESGSRRSKAPGAIGVNIFTHVAPLAPVDPLEYRFHGMASRAITEIVFPNSVPSGATVWVSCCWMTRRGRTSIASTPISFALQGGAITATAA